jgi:hypothetical protein
VSVDETVGCGGIGSGEATDRLLALAQNDYRAVKVASNRVEFARTYRPTWAIVVGIALLPVLVGAFFFLVKSTETWTATVEEDHRSVRVRISGNMLPHLLLAVREAMAAGPAQAPAPLTPGMVSDAVATPSAPVSPSPLGTPIGVPPGVAPVGSAPMGSATPAPAPSAIQPPSPLDLPVSFAAGDEARTTLRPSAAPAPQVERQADLDATRLGAARTPAHRYVLRFDDGQECAVSAYMLVGRDPAPAPGEQGGELVALDDRSVSKTHLSIRADSTGVWVTDRGSTNGTFITDLRRQVTRLNPGDATLVQPGSLVQVGKRSFDVDEAAG